MPTAPQITNKKCFLSVSESCNTECIAFNGTNNNPQCLFLNNFILISEHLGKITNQLGLLQNKK